MKEHGAQIAFSSDIESSRTIRKGSGDGRYLGLDHSASSATRRGYRRSACAALASESTVVRLLLRRRLERRVDQRLELLVIWLLRLVQALEIRLQRSSRRNHV